MTRLSYLVEKVPLFSVIGPAFLLSAFATLAQAAPATAPSLLIDQVVIVDGTGAPSRAGAVRIAGGKIIEVSTTGGLTAQPGETVINGHGLVLAPGFIDSHSHHDTGIFEQREAIPVISQGVTTIIVGQDGSSHVPLADFFGKLAATPAAVNVGSYSGHNTLRNIALRDTDMKRPASAVEIARMSKLLIQDIKAGAFGISTGLGYESGIHSTPEEVQQLAIVAAKHGGRYISHIRNENVRVNESVAETVAIGRRTHAPTQISHIKIAAKQSWGEADNMLRRLDKARAEGVNITADVYPYTYWQTTMQILLEGGALDDRARVERAFETTVPPELIRISIFAADPSVVGKSVAEIARARGKPPGEAYIQLLKQAADYGVAHPSAPRPLESVIGTSMDEKDVIAFLRWEHSNICSDGSNRGHPRGHGAFTRVLGKYVREQHVLTLEQAVHKMTGLTAKHLGITDRGEIKAGAAADLVLFDPRTVADRATIQDPTARSVGIETVWVNGEIVYAQGKATSRYPGKVIKRL